ncbi:MAG: sigma-54-dependent Fis family transcriptional regulator [Zetaproteobacteria bacterium]|nr:MAG: sigma-54-dependent Fis family transcriptional regulator [Zetaproteobacteria bacterium]
MRVEIVVIDDDPGIRWVLERTLRDEGFVVASAETLQEGVALVESGTPQLLFLDMYLPDGNGMEALSAGRFGAVPVVLLTAQTTFDHAVASYRSGAMEYLPKPFDLDEVRALARRVVSRGRDDADAGRPREAGAPRSTARNEMIVGRSPAMQQLFRTLGRVAASDLTVLITGESGTGKEIVARVLHEESGRSRHPFVAINTAAIPADLLESELFGHEKGAFTGADRARAGLFEQADGGTLFLDEIGDMPLPLQAKLLRVLESGTIQRVGGGRERPVDVRLLAATHCNLPAKIEQGRFRRDLYYRLNVIPVRIPPLRERRDDIPLLAEHFLQEASAELRLDAPILTDGAIEALTRYRWEGNVRELKNVMRRLAVLTPGPAITPNDVALALGGARHEQDDAERLDQAVTRCMQQYIDLLGTETPTDLHRVLLDQVEPALLRLVLGIASGNQVQAANMLGINRNTLRKLLRRYRIDPFAFRTTPQRR